MAPDDADRYLAGSRHAWLKLLRLCLTELGVEEPTAAYLVAIASQANPRRQMVVKHIEQKGEFYHFYGADRSFYVTAPRQGHNMLTLLGRTITYVPDGPDHGWLVTEPQEPQP
jgi:hypothetical protein